MQPPSFYTALERSRFERLTVEEQRAELGLYPMTGALMPPPPFVGENGLGKTPSNVANLSRQ